MASPKPPSQPHLIRPENRLSSDNVMLDEFFLPCYPGDHAQISHEAEASSNPC